MDKNIIEQINKLAEKTHERKIAWEIVNPSFFRWVREDHEGKKTFTTTLQKQVVAVGNPPKAQLQYFITIQTTNPNEIILQASSALDPDLMTCLRNLQNVIVTTAEEIKAEKLKKFIDGIE